MQSLFLSGALALALSGSGLAQVATAPPTAADYVTKAGQSDQFEIQTGRLAMTKAASSEVRTFGSQMVQDHAKSTALITAAAQKSKLRAPPAPPPPLNPDQQAMLTELQALSGAAFDKDYVAQQLTAHQQALALHTNFANRGDDVNLRAAADQVVPVVQQHLGMLQAMSAQAKPDVGPAAH